MYKLVISLKDAGEYETFPEAFRVLYEKVRKMIEDGIPEQMLSMIWIEGEVHNLKYVLMLKDAVNLAHEIKLLSGEGKLQEIIVGLSEEALITAAELSAAMAVVIRQEEVDTGKITRELEEMIKRYGWQQC